MIFPFTRVPADLAGIARPLLSIELEGLVDPVTCLLDTGSVKNRLASEWAHEAHIDLVGRETEVVGVGGTPVTFHLVDDVQLTVGETSLSAPVWFGENWKPPFGLLGQEGFLRHFVFELRAADERFRLDEAVG